MTLSTTSLAAGTAVTFNNTPFAVDAAVISRKILIGATGDPAKSLTPLVPVLITSPEHCSSISGAGFMAHRLAIEAFKGSEGVETWLMPQDEIAGAVAADGSILNIGTTSAAGTFYLYIANVPVPVAFTKTMTATEQATAIIAAITAKTSILPVTAAVDGTDDTQVNITSKSKGLYGNYISIEVNLGYGESTPAGITATTIVDMASGAGVPDFSAALDALGTGEDANEAFFTDLVHGYCQDSTTMDAISTYVGAGNTSTGLWEKLVGRPFRYLTGDTVAGSGGLSALTALGDARPTDRSGSIFPVPGSASHPSEIAAQVIGHVARINNAHAQADALEIKLIGIHTGAKADRWTSDFDSRDLAVKSGICTSKIENGVVVIKDLVTFYHPDDVPIASNGYRRFNHISILQNFGDGLRSLLEATASRNIVTDISLLRNFSDRKLAIDVDIMKGLLASYIQSAAQKAWLYETDYALQNIVVAIRTGNDGFETNMKIILSGVNAIQDSTVDFDTAITVTL